MFPKRYMSNRKCNFRYREEFHQGEILCFCFQDVLETRQFSQRAQKVLRSKV